MECVKECVKECVIEVCEGVCADPKRERTSRFSYGMSDTNRTASAGVSNALPAQQPSTSHVFPQETRARVSVQSLLSALAQGGEQRG